MIPKLGLSTGYDVRFVDTSDVVNMFKRLRRSDAFGRPFRYVGVTELGSKRGRPHVHILFFIPKYDGDSLPLLYDLEHKMFKCVLSEWKRRVNYGVGRSAKFLPCCTYVQRFVRGKLRSTFDLHYVNPVLTDGSVGDVAFYVSKYMIKESDKLKSLQRALKLNLPDDEYADVWKLVKPRWFASPQFGLNSSFNCLNDYTPSPVVLNYIRHCVDVSKSEFDSPKFINPVDGSAFPLGRYYINRADCFTVVDKDFFGINLLIKVFLVLTICLLLFMIVSIPLL